MSDRSEFLNALHRLHKFSWDISSAIQDTDAEVEYNKLLAIFDTLTAERDGLRAERDEAREIAHSYMAAVIDCGDVTDTLTASASDVRNIVHRLKAERDAAVEALRHVKRDHGNAVCDAGGVCEPHNGD